MSDAKQAQDQLSVLFSQRFDERDATPTEEPPRATKRRKRGRPPKSVKRKTASFFVVPELLARLDDAYYQFNAGLSKETRMSRAEFREMVLEKGLEQL